MPIAFKSYCWTMGTTSFRTAQLNRRTEEQLRLLRDFWAKPEFANTEWDTFVQTRYYDYMLEKKFVVGCAARSDKDAREKTSGLVELGLVNKNRRLTDAGRNLLAIADKGYFHPDDDTLFGISQDSHLYFLQLLKACKTVNGNPVRPFVAFLYLMSMVEADSDGWKYLTKNEFTYLLPLCVSQDSTRSVAMAVNEARKTGKTSDIDAAVLSILLGMDNYREALDAFLSSPDVSEDLICLVGMNRKSGAKGTIRYDAPYEPVFNALHEMVFNGVSEVLAKKLVDSIGALNGKGVQAGWKSRLFGTHSGGRLTVPFSDKIRLSEWPKDESGFRTHFFETLHLFKAKATLEDYADLNRRYFSLSDCVAFHDERVELEPLPAIFVERLADWISTTAFSKCVARGENQTLETIVGRPLPTKEELVVAATGLSPDEVKKRGGVSAVVKEERYRRFDSVLSARFGKDEVSRLLCLLEDRANDGEIQKSVTDDADVPTIFEYLVALAWYYISGKKGDVLEYMNLSLGADFLPKTHAGGGEADIVWQYDENQPHYPRHALLIEATLSEKDSQRRMEMEPVSRHLGDYLLQHREDKYDYCAFVTTHLNPNVLSDFRSRKKCYYYDQYNDSNFIQGMKIIPLDTALLRTILDSDLLYSDLYELFERMFQMELAPRGWFKKLQSELQSYQSNVHA